MPYIRLIPAPGLCHVAVIDHDILLDYALWYPGWSDGWGDIYYGRVTKHLSAIGGSFVLLPHDISGFLPDKTKRGNYREGDKIFVRVTRSAQGGKNVRLETYTHSSFSIKNPNPHLVQQGPTPLEEIARRWSDSPLILNAPHLLPKIPIGLRDRIKSDNTPLSSKIYEQLDALKETHIELPKGMQASIIPTPALTAIDMDSVTLSQDHQNKKRAQFQANQEALPFLLRQLSLRNLSGAIFIDLIGLPIKKRRLLQRDIEKSLAKDPLSPRLLGFTHLGLAEIVRAKKRPPLHEILASDHGRAIDLLDHIAQEFYTVQNRYRYRQITLHLNIYIYRALLKDPWAIEDFEHHCSVKLNLETHPSFTRQQWEYSYV